MIYIQTICAFWGCILTKFARWRTLLTNFIRIINPTRLTYTIAILYNVMNVLTFSAIISTWNTFFARILANLTIHFNHNISRLAYTLICINNLMNINACQTTIYIAIITRFCAILTCWNSIRIKFILTLTCSSIYLMIWICASLAKCFICYTR